MTKKTWPSLLPSARAILAYLRVMRAHGAITSVAAVAVAAILLDRSPLDTPALLASLAVALITAAGITLNDYYDSEIDKINKPGRAIPSGAVSKRAALFLSWMLFVSGIAVTLFLNLAALAIAAVNSALLIAYAQKSKKWGLAKNLAAAYLVASVFPFTAATLGKSSPLLDTLFACSFLATLSREIIKDIEDREGDGLSNSRTLPLTLGIRKAYAAAAASLLASLLVALLPCALGLLGMPSIALIATGALIWLYAFAIQSASASHKYIMAGSLVELVAFLVAKS